MTHNAGATANYVWDVNGGLPEVLQETTGTSTTTYVYGLGLISATNGGNQTYYTSDGLGSTTDLTDASGTRTDVYTYDVFGAPTHSPGSSAQPFQFAGQQTDAESGLQYLRARYYDPSVGRFLGRDPLMRIGRSSQSQNRYAYALNNPTSRIDPSGKDSETSPLACVSFALLIGSLAALLIASPATGIILSVALLAVAASIDLYANDNLATSLDLSTALAFLVLPIESNLLRGLFVLDLAYTGAACNDYLTR